MLKPSEIEQYREEGYLVFEGLMRGAMLEKYLALFDELVEKSAALPGDEHWAFELDEGGRIKPGKILHKIQGVCFVEPRVLEVAKEPEILGRVSSLLGSELDVFGTKFFPLLPGGGTSTKWHQDNFYFDSESDRIVTCGIYLQKTDRENGCLKIIPKSHRAGLRAHIADRSTYGSWVDVDESQAVDLEVPAGTVLLFSANLLHGANPNRSGRTRYSAAWHYVPGDLDLPNFRRGEYEDRHIVQEAGAPK
jgi:ectoine hydroxylase-related dioxygenase (phytanoyl-CoA dioxygenase family)